MADQPTSDMIRKTGPHGKDLVGMGYPEWILEWGNDRTKSIQI
jgi:hypothetical protein